MAKNLIERDYGGIIPYIRWMRRISQVISGSTASVGIYLVIYSNLSIGHKIAAISITLFLTLVVILAFEGGITKFYPFWFRQIINWIWEDKNEPGKQKGIRGVLFAMLSAMLIPLVIGTTIMSRRASPEITEFSFEKAETVNIDELSIKEQEQINTIKVEQRSAVLADSIQFAQLLALEAAKWKNKIKAINQKAKRFDGLDPIEHPWAKGSANTLRKVEVPRTKNQKNEALANIKREAIASRKAIEQDYQSQIAMAMQDKSLVLKDAKQSNDNSENARKQRVDKWSGFLVWLAVGATAFTLFCLTFEGLYEAGRLRPGVALVSHRKRPKWWPFGGNDTADTDRHGVTQPDTSSTKNELTDCATDDTANSGKSPGSTPGPAKGDDTTAKVSDTATSGVKVVYVDLSTLKKRVRRNYELMLDQEGDPTREEFFQDNKTKYEHGVAEMLKRGFNTVHRPGTKNRLDFPKLEDNGNSRQR